MTQILKFCDSAKSLQSNRIVTEARRWIGIPFRHQGRGIYGLDCLGLLIVIAGALDLRDRQHKPLWYSDDTAYGHAPDADRLSRSLSDTLHLQSDYYGPGDVLLMQVQGQATHLGVVSGIDDGAGLIHAYAPARKVVEHRLSAEWEARIVGAFRVPN